MKRSCRFCLCVLALSAGLHASAATVLAKADARLWETVVDRQSPISWPWEDGADSATLVFSNRATHAVSSVAVARREGESRGSLEQPAPPQGVESVVDVSLVQSKGGAAFPAECATLAYVSGAGGGPLTVRAERTREWGKVRALRVFADEPAWHGESGAFSWGIAWPVFIGLGVVIR